MCWEVPDTTGMGTGQSMGMALAKIRAGRKVTPKFGERST